ncbi:hypothetical protein [Aquimonas sp.]|jgi:hypothetical protein|uniref:hypothetical protein n=1 Tax=Aquimonas sp. TaxID=1872588 RepID=UPI0037BE577C
MMRNLEFAHYFSSALAPTHRILPGSEWQLAVVELADDRGITYHIDGLNRRAGKSIDGVRQWGMLYVNQLEPVAELDVPGNLVASFLYADRPHVPSLMLKGGRFFRRCSPS